MKNASGEKIGGAAALMVFCIFAMLILTVLTLGAGAYRNIAMAAREGSDERLSLSFIWTMVKNHDNSGGMYVDDFDGLPALFINEEYGDTVYQTVIYHLDGWVYELFAEDVTAFRAGDGVRVIEVESLHFVQLDDGNILAQSGEVSVFISPRGEKNSQSAMNDER